MNRVQQKPGATHHQNRAYLSTLFELTRLLSTTCTPLCSACCFAQQLRLAPNPVTNGVCHTDLQPKWWHPSEACRITRYTETQTVHTVCGRNLIDDMQAARHIWKQRQRGGNAGRSAP